MDLYDSARRRLSRETSLVAFQPGRRLRVVIAYPNSYWVGMSNLGLHTLYRLFNDHPEVSCERVFLPDPDELESHSRTATALFSLETQTPIDQFDLVAFSASFENDYPNLLRMLDLARIPFRSAERDDTSPLIAMGGATVSINPEPVADFLDLACVGEGEELVEPLIEALLRGGDRAQLLGDLAQINGFYVPALYQPSYVEGADGIRRFERLDASDTAPPLITKVRADLRGIDRVAATAIRTPDTEFGDRVTVEVARGCTKGCRYCWVGYSILPFRVHRPEDILARIEPWSDETDRVGLVATALLDHPDIESIAAALRDRGLRVFSPSLIISTLREPLLEAVIDSGQQTITVAPEAGSDRMRELIMKKISNEEILAKTRMIFRAGAVNLKNYIIIGLPGETDEDLDAIIELGAAMRQIMVEEGRERGRIGRITMSINCLIPKPGTPLQWAEQLSVRAYRRKLRYLHRLAAAVPNLVIDAMPPRAAQIQAVMSRGDRRVSELLEQWHELGSWSRALRSWSARVGMPLEEILRAREPREPVPWQHLRVGPAPPALTNQWNRAIEVAERPSTRTGTRG